ncbi:MAG TPA: hypothetical protein PK179_12495 [Spirochaetales bacterium]|nr:hypothetical protein [Spirochaetales bacterium]
MCRTTKSGTIEFYQPKAIRKISIFEIILFIFGIYIIYRLWGTAHTIQGIFISSIYSIIVAARYIAPTFQKQFNAHITDKQLVLDNIDFNPIKINLNTITSVSINDQDAVIISGRQGEATFEYKIALDPVDRIEFTNIINMRIQDYRNKIVKEIEMAFRN